MIFRLPYSWLKEYVWVPNNPHDLARQLSLYGPSVERVAAVRHEFNKVVVGEIIDIESHPNANKLRIAMVRANSGAPLRIVCGAPNIEVGQKVPLALVGATLPGGITVSRREVRGVVSEGMLCSARELGIHDDHLGILILSSLAKVGTPVAKLGQYEDYVWEVEPTINRPDLCSVIGIAREVGAITAKPLRRYDRQMPPSSFLCPISVEVWDKKLCSRFMAVLIRDVRVGPSPWQMQERIARAGIRPINAAVDITNYVMLEYGQPLHVYDADKLGRKIIVRQAKNGETILALDGKKYNLKTSHLVIANAVKPVAIAGVMGGEETAVNAETKNVVIECANFDAALIRRTSRDLQLFSESSRLFEKGLSSESPSRALARAAELTLKICGGQASTVVDRRASRYRSETIKFSLDYLPKLLGLNIPRLEVRQILKKLGFNVSGQGKILKVVVPYWRDHDVCCPEDLVEEVARLYGYQRFPSVLPPLESIRPNETSDFSAEDYLRRELAAGGFTEALSYSLISERWIKALKYNPADVLSISNSLTNDLIYLRPSLLPSLAAIAEANLVHHEKIQIFEIAKLYTKGGDSQKGIEQYRQEQVFVGGLIIETGESAEHLYRRLKGIVEALGGVSVDKSDKEKEKIFFPFAAGLSALMKVKGSSETGVFGILEPVFLKVFGLNQLVGAFELPLSLFDKSKARSAYKPVPKFPAVKRDLSLALDRNVRYTDIVSVLKAGTPLLESVELFDIYQDDKIGSAKQSYALHLIFRAPDRTLSSAEIDVIEKEMSANLRKKLGVALR